MVIQHSLPACITHAVAEEVVEVKGEEYRISGSRGSGDQKL